MRQEPTNEDLQDLEETLAAEGLPPELDSLDDLYSEVMTQRRMRRPTKPTDVALDRALSAELVKMKQLYSNPENWTRTRGLALIDKQTHTLIGNFSEYVHKTVPNTRKLLREHSPIAVDGSEEIEGYLGPALEQSIRHISWEREFSIQISICLDELQVEAPHIQLQIFTRMSETVRAVLAADTQFASASGNVLLSLPAGTDIIHALSVDSKIAVRKAVEVQLNQEA